MAHPTLESVAIGVVVAAVCGLLLARPAYIVYLLPWSLVTWIGIVPLPAVGPFAAIRVNDILVALLVIAAGVSAFVHPQLIVRDRTFVGVPALLVTVQLFMAIVGATHFESQRLLLDVMVFLKNWGMYAVLPLSLAVFRGQIKLKLLERSILWSSAVGIASSIHQFLAGEARAAGLVDNPNRFGILMVVYLSITVACLVSTPAIRTGKNVTTLVLLQLLAILLSGSRAAVLGAGTVMTWAFMRTLRSSDKLRMVIVAIIVMILVFVSPAGSAIVPRFENLFQGDANVQARILGFATGLKMVVAHPLGLGPAWRLDPDRVLRSEALVYVPGGTLQVGPHTLYLNWILDSSWLGLASLLCIMWIWFRGPRVRGRTEAVAQWSLALRLIVTSMAVIGVFDQPFMLSQVSCLTWLVAGVAGVSLHQTGVLRRVGMDGCEIPKLERNVPSPGVEPAVNAEVGHRSVKTLQ